MKQTPAYKNKLKALELERSGAVNNKKKGSKTRIRLGFFYMLNLELGSCAGVEEAWKGHICAGGYEGYESTNEPFQWNL